ncbi:DegV family protein [Anoxynatronum buryatiense]|uniref:EDD domain protein, DegV family n=1 Tax=Anoxynatronum buryatiense TaxID=489973 RepID=A0AA45WSR3_9CLOT|nr:DegV family protein [Anoxynatronum buryatiense]SMP38999.1 EDD domain protein, DegV family [Anoxynatronum buryatiense]
MHRIRIMTDSTSDLPDSFVQEHHIAVIPLYVNFNDRVFRDGVDLNPEQLYQTVAETDVFPKTSSPSPSDFLARFTPAIEAGDDILFIGISSRLSSTIQNARIAASEFEDHRIEVIDSLNLSAGIGILVMKAVMLLQEESLSLSQLADRIRTLVPKVRTYFAVDTLEYLHRGGRCSAMENLVGSMLRIRPILEVVEGQIIVNRKVRGKREKLMNEMLELFRHDHPYIVASPVVVNQSMCAEDAQKLSQQILDLMPEATITLTQAGCVICSHCGPKTFSIVFLRP